MQYVLTIEDRLDKRMSKSPVVDSLEKIAAMCKFYAAWGVCRPMSVYQRRDYNAPWEFYMQAVW